MACSDTPKTNENTEASKANDDLLKIFENYYHERIQLVPLEGTQNGDTIAQ